MWRSIKQIAPDRCLAASSFHCLLWSVWLLTILHVFDCFTAIKTTLALVRLEVGVQDSRFDRTHTSSLFWRGSCSMSISFDDVVLF